MYSVSKLMWVKNKDPETWRKASRICLIGDYAIYLLTGRAQIDYSLAARTMAFDIRSLDWSSEVLAAAGIQRDLLPRPIPTGASAGKIRPGIAERVGLSPDTLIISSGHDQVAAAVGSGVFDEGVAVDGAGTVQCVTPVFRGVPKGRSMADGNYAVVPYVEPGKYVCYAFSFTGGAVVKWFTETLAGYAAAKAAQRNTSVYSVLEGDGPRRVPTGLLVLPHFAGAATPYMDYGSKGAILGLTLDTTQEQLYAAVMEGVCLEMRLNIERLNKAGVDVSSLKATGGGANSRMWMQMKADVLGIPVTSLRTPEAGGAGASMMAGVAAGIYSDVRHAAAIIVQERETFLPNEKVKLQYDEVYARYQRLYSAIRPLI